MSLQTKSRWMTAAKVTLVTLLVAAGIAIGSSLYSGLRSNTAQDQLEKEYVGPGKCLDRSPFDPESGALVYLKQVDGKDVLFVIPDFPNTYTPSTLTFFVDPAWGAVKTLVPRDVETRNGLSKLCGTSA